MPSENLAKAEFRKRCEKLCPATFMPAGPAEGGAEELLGKISEFERRLLEKSPSVSAVFSFDLPPIDSKDKILAKKVSADGKVLAVSTALERLLFDCSGDSARILWRRRKPEPSGLTIGCDFHFILEDTLSSPPGHDKVLLEVQVVHQPKPKSFAVVAEFLEIQNGRSFATNSFGLPAGYVPSPHSFCLRAAVEEAEVCAVLCSFTHVTHCCISLADRNFIGAKTRSLRLPASAKVESIAYVRHFEESPRATHSLYLLHSSTSPMLFDAHDFSLYSLKYEIEFEPVFCFLNHLKDEIVLQGEEPATYKVALFDKTNRLAFT